MNILQPGQSLGIEERLVSETGAFEVKLQSDGNVVEYNFFGPIWHSDTAGQSPAQLVMQHDGNLVAYNVDGQPYWATDTSGNDGAFFKLNRDGRLQVINAEGTAVLWQNEVSQEQPVDPLDEPYTILVVSDQHGKSVVGALVSKNDGEDSRYTDGSGFIHMPSVGTNKFTISGDGIDTSEFYIDGGEHSVQVVRQGANHPDQLIGILGVNDQGFTSAHGPVNPVFAHMGDGFLAFTEGKDVDTALDRIRDAGYHGVRFWVPLVWQPENSPFWGNRSASPLSLPNFWSLLDQFVDKLISRGLKVYASVGGLFGADDGAEDDYARGLADLISRKGKEHFFLPLEVNEARDTGDRDDKEVAEIEQFVRIVYNQHPELLYALTGWTGDTTREDVIRWTVSWMKLYYFHGYRANHYWDKIRHMFSNGYENYKGIRKYGFVGEDVGPGPLVSVTDNKHELTDSVMALIGVQAILSGIGYTYISSPGIILNEPIDKYAGFYSVPRAIKLLPKDVMSYTTLHHSGSSWSHIRVFGAVGEVRVDGRTNHDGKFAYTVYGPGNHVTLPVHRSCEVSVIDPASGQVRFTVTRRAGESLTLDYDSGVILLGHTI